MLGIHSAAVKPRCPVCGELMITGIAYDDLDYVVYCQECGIRVKVNDYERYVKLHNERFTFENFIERFGTTVTRLRNL